MHRDGDARDFSGVTETPGDQISREAASMVLSRYDLVRRVARGRRVLEVACGSGQGLGFVATQARMVVGGDITFRLLIRARNHYGPGQPLVQFDAHALPFLSGSFDLVEMHEAVYYMRDARAVFQECKRVLSRTGRMIVSSINPAWPDFNPSPHAARYLTAPELEAALGSVFSHVEMLYGFAADSAGRRPWLSTIKRFAVRFRLIPKTMAGKRLLKRVFLGPLVTVPMTLTDSFAPVDEPRPAAGVGGSTSNYKVLYAIAST